MNNRPKYSVRAVFLLLLLSVLPGGAWKTSNAQEENQVAIDVLHILYTDELGERLRYPSSVTYDPEMDEIYVVVGGEGKVIVYGANFFPLLSLGKGRQADAPRGVYIHQSGTVFLSQSYTENKPARLTLFNAAFFPEKEIVFNTVPDGENFVPQNVVIGHTGNIYIVGLNQQGVLVLDEEGTFSHWLVPKDRLIPVESEDSIISTGPEETTTDLASEVAQTRKEEAQNINMRDLLPAELLPSINEELEVLEETEPQPVQIGDIRVDSQGRLYLLSEETSKTYVYSPEEEFLFSFGQKGGSTGKMSRPKNLAIDEKKKAIYIVDYMRHTILIFDMNGKFMHEFGGMGTGPGWFQFPVGLELNKEGNLIVADLFNQRVQILDIHFEYKYPLSVEREQPTYVAPETDEPHPKPGRDPDTDTDTDTDDDDILYLPLPVPL